MGAIEAGVWREQLEFSWTTPQQQIALWRDSHAFVVWAAATFWRNPVDDLIGVGDVAGFAVDTVGRVDFQFRLAFFRDHLVNRRRTKILAGVAVLADAAIAANIGLEHDEMARLILFMARAGMIDVREAIERELAVAFEARGLIHQRAAAIQL